jgi:hypothetical protein
MGVAGGWRRVQQFWSIAALSWGILLAVLSVIAKPSSPPPDRKTVPVQPLEGGLTRRWIRIY